MIKRLRDWIDRALCQHPLAFRDYRFRWEGEHGVFYEECLKCGKEFLQ